MKIEENQTVDLLSRPHDYQKYLEVYGLMGESYRNLYTTMMAFQPKKIKEPDLGFLHQELGIFHATFHEFLGESSFLREEFGIQIVFMSDHPCLIHSNKLIDFGEIEEKIDTFCEKSILFHHRIKKQIEIEFSAIELVLKDYEKFLMSYLGHETVNVYLAILNKNFKNALRFSVYGILYNFYLPLMELMRRGYYYLGYGWSRDYRPCYYIGICK